MENKGPDSEYEDSKSPPPSTPMAWLAKPSRKAAILLIVMALIFAYLVYQGQIVAEQNNVAVQAADTQVAQSLTVADQSQATLQAVQTQVVALNTTAQVAQLDAETSRLEATQQANVAFSRQLAAQAMAHFDKNLDLSLLLSLEALQVNSTYEARNGLLTGLQKFPQLRTLLKGSPSGVKAIAYDPKSKILMASGVDSRIRFWDLTDRVHPLAFEVPLINATAPGANLAFDPARKILVTSSSQLVFLWDLSDFKSPKLLGSPLKAGYIAAIALSPDGKTLVVADNSETLSLWDITVPDFPDLYTFDLNSFKDTADTLAFSPDSQMLALGIANGDVVLLDTSQPKVARVLSGALGLPDSYVDSLAFSPNSKTLALGGCGFPGYYQCQQGRVVFWNLSVPASPQLLSSSSTAAGVDTVAFSPTGNILALTMCGTFSMENRCEQGNIFLWDVHEPSKPFQISPTLTAHTDLVNSVAFNSEGTFLMSGGQDGNVMLWDVTQPAALDRLGTTLTGTANLEIYDLAISPNGKLLAVAGCDSSGLFECRTIDLGLVDLWDISNRNSPVLLTSMSSGQPGPIFDVAFSPDSKTLVGASDKWVSVWDMSHPSEPLRLNSYNFQKAGFVWRAVFNPKDSLLATAMSDDRILLWDMSNPKTPQVLNSSLQQVRGFYDLSFSNDGKLLAFGGADKTIVLWDVTNPELPKQKGVILSDDDSYPQSLAFSSQCLNSTTTACQQVLAVGYTGGLIKLWDVSNPAMPQLVGQPARSSLDTVYNLAFSLDGQQLASTYAFLSTSLWDTSAPTLPQPLGLPLFGELGSGSVVSLAFSPDGKNLVVGGRYATVTMWKTDVEAWQVQACQIAGRNLSQTEWKLYMGDRPYHKTCEAWPEGDQDTN